MDESESGEYAEYLERLDEDEQAFFALKEASEEVVPFLERSLRDEDNPRKRAAIVEVLWQRRQSCVIPILGRALLDPSPEVWKQALDGLVALGHPECRAAIGHARSRKFDSESERAYYLAFWTKQ